MVPAREARQQGFTYLALLFVIALGGIGMAAVGSLWSLERQREKEVELLFAGDQFRAAIASYYERSPGLLKRYPTKLEELLKDNRFLTTQRHLRLIYRDPMMEEPQWGLIAAPEGGIMGVYSLTKAESVKRSGFAFRNAEFEGKTRIGEWRFVYRPIPMGTAQSLK